MNLKQIAKDTAKTLQSYLTYQALRTVLAQLGETNPPLELWLHNFSSGKIQNGESFIEQLLREKPDLALRIMTVREHIAEEIAEFLPEMVRTGIQQGNMEQRRQHLERITQVVDTSSPSLQPEQQATSDQNLDNLSN
ncbi:RuBisCO chaperone RbcX [Nostoc sp. 'Peltigera malacea cyanobiont' DB3992]|uniref:RuBisCO chaperone RbcX n=4 Tax=Nostoc cyanobionts TaxID=3123326 RepID=A0A2H4PVC1_9NOSO|nr:chaperonin family protein RbcX [Nostoc sp. 'Peltigera malacea cyanobiont' DB3992]AGG34888.1 chaperonin-like protein [Nostoc sp. 'Peltigera neckeri cyanobiont']ATW74781.1 chaperonin-like protein [Nostoc sp. 'Peltigera ponojensis cyanobiont']AZB51488.1 chaperonin-like protein [Nostoc sp. 'cyanobiont of Peltigera ponojensis']AZB51540.1 chaperonin-like protein [Nostoc sp. 'cyanobiont of Peltigera monticola']WPZ98881.1 chaperonin-like protein [Nostoc sp. IJ90]